MQQVNKELYELIEGIGEIQYGDFHILDNAGNETIKELNEGTYRVYIKAGYCFDVIKSYVCDADEVEKFARAYPDGFAYAFFAEWPGFLSINANLAYIMTLALKNDINKDAKQ